MRAHIQDLNTKIRQACKTRGICLHSMTDTETGLLTDDLIEQNKITPDTANQVLQDITKIESLNPTKINFTTRFIHKINILFNRQLLLKYGVFPIKFEKNKLHLIMSIPDERSTIKVFESISGSTIQVYCCNGMAIRSAIDMHFPEENPVHMNTEKFIEDATGAVSQHLINQSDLMDMINDPRVIQLLQHIFNTHITMSTSDLHFEPHEKDFLIRFRENGMMRDVLRLPKILKHAIIPRLKLISGMDINETKISQDGSISYGLIHGRDIEIRVSALPVIYGEKLVLRLLDMSKVLVQLNDLGMTSNHYQLLEKALHRSHGLILVTGPTGSGKTTTLYASLNQVHQPHINILTAEDPVEYRLKGINQVECMGDLTYAAALKTFLRQDPDIIMVGEIRDLETADIALKASMTGHLVLSTLHTNDAPSSLSRLIQMGIPPYLIISVNPVIVAQRLMRKICLNCKTPDKKINAIDNTEEIQTYKGIGCDQCFGTGYQGRVGIFEIMLLSDNLVPLILNHASASQIRETAIQNGLITLRQSALENVRQGITTMEELYRVT